MPENFTKEFKQSVEANDVLAVKIMLKDMLIIDLTFKEFDEMAKYAETRLTTPLWEEFEPTLSDHSEDDSLEDELDMEMVLLIENFSRERVKKIKGILEKLYPYSKKRGVKRTQSRARIETLKDELDQSLKSLEKKISRSKRDTSKYKYSEVIKESKKLIEIAEECQSEWLEVLKRRKQK